MSIWDRLGRIARAELNNLQDKLRDSMDRDEDQDVADAEDDLPDLDPEPADEVDDDPSPYKRQRKKRRKRKGPEDETEADRAWRGSGDTWPREIREAYAALELPLGSDREAVKAGYRKMLRRYHPDKHAGDPERERLANEVTRRLREAYEKLDKYLAERSRS